ncbi:MAG: hypothetical protein CL521_00265 [Actinobacteria bacterium]|nr:hypothetical protein [Actinomycetota bacterium]
MNKAQLLKILPAIVIVAAGAGIIYNLQVRDQMVQTVTQKTSKSAISQAQLRQVTYEISGMTCGACTSKIKKALVENDAIKDIQINLEKESGVVEFNHEAISPTQIKELIDSLGFTASIAQPKGKLKVVNYNVDYNPN